MDFLCVQFHSTIKHIKLNNNFMLCVMIGEVLWLEFYIYFYC